jgi:hypothetical protein
MQVNRIPEERSWRSGFKEPNFSRTNLLLSIEDFRQVAPDFFERFGHFGLAFPDDN